MTDDRPADKGDFVVMDFEGTLNGEKYKELKADDYFLEIGSQKFVPGFEDQLIGMKKGEAETFTYRFRRTIMKADLPARKWYFTLPLRASEKKNCPKTTTV